MYGVATPMCVRRRHAARHRRCKGVKVVGRRASPCHRKNYALNTPKHVDKFIWTEPNHHLKLASSNTQHTSQIVC